VVEDVIKERDNGVTIEIKVHPGSSRKEVRCRKDDILAVFVHSPPEKGKANKEVIKLLSKALEVPSSRLEIIKGERSRRKTILIKDICVEEVTTRLHR